MYSNFERKKKSQLKTTTLIHHSSTLGPRIHVRVKGFLTFFFVPPFFFIKYLIENFIKLK
jgi:hypothetical protein